jgi:hypothetical protein
MIDGLGISSFNGSISRDGKIFGVMIGTVVKNDSSNADTKPGPGLVKVSVPLIGMKESCWAGLFHLWQERKRRVLPSGGG